ncbi:hypothetical protein EMCRGX_G019142 [Ephydatia muelleri]
MVCIGEVERMVCIGEVERMVCIGKVERMVCIGEVERMVCIGEVERMVCIGEVERMVCIGEVERMVCIGEVERMVCIGEVERMVCIGEVERMVCIGEVERMVCIREVERMVCIGEVERMVCIGEVERMVCIGEVERMRRTRRQLTRAQKRQEWKNCWQKEGGAGGKPDLDFGAAEVRELQNTDESLAEIRLSIKDGHPEFVEKDSLIYRDTWEKELPSGCCSGSYWPNIYKDVAYFCRNCARCQKACNRRGLPVPLIPLPIMSEPFSRIAMEIVGPLPRSSKGHKYILVICNYGTQYPEAVPLRTCDAEAVAEELVVEWAFPRSY